MVEPFSDRDGDTVNDDRCEDKEVVDGLEHARRQPRLSVEKGKNEE